MNELTQSPTITLEGTEIRMDAQGRYCLNDLHKASGGEEKNKPKFWLENKQTQELIQELSEGGILPSLEIQPVSVIRGGLNQGTYVVKELVYSYAMWISPAFNLKVIRTFDAVVTGKIQPTITAKRQQFNLGTVTRQCVMMAKACGLKDNQAILSADRAVKQLTGESPLQLLGATHLHAPVQQIVFTPTQIGQQLEPSISAVKVNVLLADLGLQIKIGENWTPTQKGMDYAEVMDTQKRHSDGTPVKQVKWFSSVMDLLKPYHIAHLQTT